MAFRLFFEEVRLLRFDFSIPADVYTLRFEKKAVCGREYDRMLERGSIRVNRAVALGDMYLGPNTKVVAYLDPKIYEARFTWDHRYGSESSEGSWKPRTWNLVRHIEERFLVIDKPSGISTIASKDHPRGALIPYWLRSHLPRGVGTGSLLTTSRLDAGTHGLLVVGRSKEFVKQYNNLISSRKVTKKYVVAVTGWNKPSFDGKASFSRQKYKDRFLVANGSIDRPKRHLGMWEHWTIEKKEEKRLGANNGCFELEPSVPEQIVMDDSRKKDWNHLLVNFSRIRSSLYTVPVQMILERAEPAKTNSVAFRPFREEWIQKQINASEASNDPIYELKLELITGKTHQIRAQLKEEGLLVVGDWLYGYPYLASKDTFALCCEQLSWICPNRNSNFTFQI